MGEERQSLGDFTAVVVAAGRAARFGAALPKQFQLLGGKSVLRRSVEAMAGHPAVRAVVVVLSAEEAAGERGGEVAGWPEVQAVVPGGETRAASVRRGVAAAETRFVLVHDAARPRVSAALIEAVVTATRSSGAAIPLLRVPDSVKTVEDNRVTGTLRREALGLAQTPQGARRDWLQAALDHASEAAEPPTDEAAALERDGRPVAVVTGDPMNRKITSAGDLTAMRNSLERPPIRLRVGTGYDIHKIAADRPLFLGGVLFEGEPGLAGHSDADVVLHAAMDALLGAVSLGDIGRHFPPDDPRWAGAASTDLARRVAELLADRGATIVNVDLTVLAERPKIRNRSEAMREAIGQCLGIDPARVGLKATTHETLGALGRGEGIACHAVALIDLAERG